MDLNEMRRRFREQKAKSQSQAQTQVQIQREDTVISDNKITNVVGSTSPENQRRESNATILDVAQSLHTEERQSQVVQRDFHANNGSRSSSTNSNNNASWNDVTQKAINLLYRLESCSYQERRESLALVESLVVPARYQTVWNQILRIWRAFVGECRLNTKTLPNPDGIKYTQRPFPITDSSGIQSIIREIVNNSLTQPGNSSPQSVNSSTGTHSGRSGKKKSNSRSANSNSDNAIWKDATQKAINLLYRLEQCSYLERNNSFAILEDIAVPTRYQVAWNQILRIWRVFVNEGRINTKTLPNPNGVRYSQRPFPVTGSSGVQDIIKEIVKNA